MKKEYVCGERPCVDKKEFDAYFAENLSIEIVNQSNKKNKKKTDLVILNTNSVAQNNVDSKLEKKQEKLRKKIEEKELKAEKKRLIAERKIIRKQEKIKAKRDRKIAKTSKFEDVQKVLTEPRIDDKNKQVKKIPDNDLIKKNSEKKDINEKIQITSSNNKNVISLCDNIKDCDIDKIAEMLIKKGKEKPFPDITSK